VLLSYFNRDVDCIRTFFRRRFRYESAVFPKFSTVVRDGHRDFDLDVEIAASGWDKNRDTELREYIETADQDVDREEGAEESGSEFEEVEEVEEEESEEEEDVPQLIAAPVEKAYVPPTVEDLARLELGGREQKPSSDASSSSEEDSDDEEADSEEGDESEEVEKEKKPKNRQPPRKSQRAGRRPQRQERNVEAIVGSNIDRMAKRQERKYHSRSAANSQTLGKSKGSKMKNDTKRTVNEGRNETF